MAILSMFPCYVSMLKCLGGGYKKGSRAQEEDLFRRTTLSSALDTDFGASVKYPMEEFSPILTRDVCVFRGPEHEGRRS